MAGLAKSTKLSSWIIRLIRDASQEGPCATAAKHLWTGFLWASGARRGFGSNPRTPGPVSFDFVRSAASLSAF
eukprot:9477281-Pyramimonas_sp.AAC.1